MTHADFHAPILDDPDDELVRLVYADWLEDRGETDRAAWVRLQCELHRVPVGDPRRADLLRRAAGALDRCRPAYWREVPGVTENRNRGLIQLYLPAAGLDDALRKLGRAAWVRAARADGWLLGAVARPGRGDLPAIAAAWRTWAAGLPLTLRSYAGLEAGAADLFALPGLLSVTVTQTGLDAVPAATLRAAQGFRELEVRTTDLDPDAARTTLARARELPALRRLTVQHAPTLGPLRPVDPANPTSFVSDPPPPAYPPADADLSALAGHPTLRKLKLQNTHVTTDGAAALEAATPGLAVTRESAVTHADWHAAVLADPDDDLVRLAYADWVEERGDTDQAAWMRLSVGLDRRWAEAGMGYHLLGDLHNEDRIAFVRCAPLWAQGRAFLAERGLVTAAVARLADLAELRGAWRPGFAASGWLLRAVVVDPTGATCRAVAAAWRPGARLRGLPVHLELSLPANDLYAADAAPLFALPELGSAALFARDLPGRLRVLKSAPGLRSLDVNLAHATAAQLAAGFGRLAWPPGLRRVTLRGTPRTPADGDVSRLAGHPNLSRLRLVDCPAVSDAAVADLLARTPGLTVRLNWR